MATPAALFDAMADDYDRAFTRTHIGRLLREAVWARCAARFEPGARILEMNCGTGEDARWLAQLWLDVLATDISPAMLEQARYKAPAGIATGRVRYRTLAWEQLAALAEPRFDGVLSNFGGLNCVADLDAAAVGLATTLRSGGIALLCVMGPRVPWEWAWYLAHGRWDKAFRRLHPAGCDWQGMTIHYPSVRRLRACFERNFVCRRVSALGALLPPPYSERRFGRHPRLLESLNRLERRLEACWPLPQLADHYLIELQRR